MLPPPLPPGPSHWKTLSLSREWRRSPLRVLLSIVRDYGDVALFRLGPTKFVILSHPDHAKHFLQDHTESYGKGWIYDHLRTVLRDGLLTSDGELWRRQRRLVAPAFQRPFLQSLVPTMEASVNGMLARWEARAAAEEAFDVHEEMLSLTLEIATRTLLGGSLSDADRRRFQDHVDFAVDRAYDRLTSALRLPYAFPTPGNLRLRKTVRELDRVVLGIIDARRDDPGPHQDLLSLLLRARDEETGETISREQLRDEVLTFIIAGYETSSSALSWAWMLLSQHPEVRRRLLEEVDQHAPRPFTFDSVLSLRYTNAVVQETMRLYPPAWLFGRNVLEEDTLGGYRIPKGAIVMVSPYLLHRDPRFWPNPEGFEPGRFLVEDETRPKFAYLPFSRGPRQCIGNHFAPLEMALVLAKASERFELDLVPWFPIDSNPRVALEPKNGIRVTARKRR